MITPFLPAFREVYFESSVPYSFFFFCFKSYLPSVPLPCGRSAPAVTSQTHEAEDPSQDGEYKLEFSTTEC